MHEFLRALWNDESGQDLAEYAMLLGLIALVVVGAVMALGGEIEKVFDEMKAQFPLDGDGGGDPE